MLEQKCSCLENEFTTKKSMKSCAFFQFNKFLKTIQKKILIYWVLVYLCALSSDVLSAK